eukprot:806045_1
MNMIWDPKGNVNNMIMCFANVLKQILNLIIDEFSRGDAVFFRLMNMIMDCKKSITYLFNWVEKQEFDSSPLTILINRWSFIQLYVLIRRYRYMSANNRLKNVYRLYWVDHGLLATINELIVVNSLPKDPLCEIMNEESTKKDLIALIPFKAWLEIIAHRECTNEMKLILAEYPP